jgi:glycosyltransferase involved in cell wall biosynthesis
VHIVFVSREYPPNPMGGIGTYVANMTRVLAEAGDRVTVLTQDCPTAPSHGFDAPHVSVNGRLRVHYLPFADAAWNLLAEARSPEADALARRDTVAAFGPIVTAALEKLLRKGDVDAIEAPEYEAPLLHFQLLRASLPPEHPWQRVPTVVHLHSPSHMIFEANDDDTANRWVRARKANEALSIQMADGVLAPSAYLARQVAAWLSLAPEKVRVIPYPIGPLLEVPEGIGAQPGLVLFVGRVEPRKGVFEFVEAAVQIAGDFPQARFRFVGGPHHRGGKSEGTETAELLKRLIPEKLRERFDFAGKVPRETLGAEYARAAFVAVPSRWENYPNTCMEALSCSRPVLASDQGGMPEMLEGTSAGIVAEGATRNALAANLARGLAAMLAKTPAELDAMGAEGRARILAICDDARIATLHREYYANLTRNLAGRPATSSLSTGVLLFGENGEVGTLAKAENSVLHQTADLCLRAVVAPPHAGRSGLFQRIETDAEGRAKNLPDLPERLAALPLPKVLYMGSDKDILPPDLLDRAANYFANSPETGACALRTIRRGELCAAFRSEREDLARPASFAERWVYRGSALAQAGGPIVRGYYLSDALRDAALRLLESGWRIGMLPVTVEVSADADPKIRQPYAFSEKGDSERDVAACRVAASHNPAD